MTEHTPGPWIADDMGKDIWIGHEDGSEDGVRVVLMRGTKKDEKTDGRRIDTFSVSDRNRADARLISAAPEMLEALEGIIDLVPTDCQGEARAAIAKAKGENHD